MSLLAILGVISVAIYSGTSLLYATLGEVVGERSGIVNLGLEGVLLVSAAVSVVWACWRRSWPALR
jgi:general nucleoside transport system permease protein